MAKRAGLNLSIDWSQPWVYIESRVEVSNTFFNLRHDDDLCTKSLMKLEPITTRSRWPLLALYWHLKKASYDFLDWGKTMRQTAASAKWQQQYFDLEVRSWSNKENMQMSLNYIANSIEMSHSAHRIVIVYCRPCLFFYRKVAWLRAKSFRWIRFLAALWHQLTSCCPANAMRHSVHVWTNYVR